MRPRRVLAAQNVVALLTRLSKLQRERLFPNRYVLLNSIDSANGGSKRRTRGLRNGEIDDGETCLDDDVVGWMVEDVFVYAEGVRLTTGQRRVSWKGRLFKMVSGFGLWAGRVGIDLNMRRPGGEIADSEIDDGGIAEGMARLDEDSVGLRVEDIFENAEEMA